MKSFTLIFIISLVFYGSLFAQPKDPYQPDIPGPLVVKVDDAKEKQVDSKDLPAAESELQEVLKQYPEYYRALFNLGLIYQAQGKTDKALETLKRAKALRDRLHISDSSILTSIGWTYMNLGKLNDAESTFLEALSEGHETTPADTERLLNNLGYLYLQKGDTVKSRFYLQKAINEYGSTGAQKVLNMANEYDVRQKAQTTWWVRIGDYADQKEALQKQQAAAKLGYSNSEIFGDPPHLHMRFRFPTKDAATDAQKKLKDGNISHQPDVLSYRPSN